MSNLAFNIKNIFRKPDNGHIQLIFINVTIFLLAVTMHLILQSTVSKEYANDMISSIFMLQPDLMSFVSKPWGLITYFFSHSLSDIFHIIGNMIGLYFFGQLFINFLGQRKFINLYILGGIVGGLAFLLAYNTIPYFIAQQVPLVGASASVLAIATGAATLAPNYEFFLFGLFRVKIKWIVLAYVVLSYWGLSGDNAGGNIAHLGGIAMGWVFVNQVKKGRDMGRWISAFFEGLKNAFRKRPKMTVNYGGKSKQGGSASSANRTSTSTNRAPSQEQIDTILDKIAKSGYSSLSAEEKRILFQASNDGK